MPPKRAAKDAGKPAGRVTKAQNASTRKTNTSLKSKVVAASAMVESSRDKSTTEAAAPTSIETQTAQDYTATPSSNTMPTTTVSARDRVVQTPELLENILRFAGCKTLLTSVLRVNKYFNATVTASPCLQKVMFESFSPPAPGQSDFANQFLFNAAIAQPFHVPGCPVSFEVGKCCENSACLVSCSEGVHFITFVFVAGEGDLVGSDTSTKDWRKLPLLMPSDTSHKSYLARAVFCHDTGFPAGAVLRHIPAYLMLGEVFDWLVAMWEEVTSD